MISRQASRPVIEKLTIQNYRVLRDVTFDHLTPLTVLFGPNGSGKSTVFDVFAFLNEAFTTNLRRAWDRRNRMHEIRSRGEDGPVVFEIKYREGRRGTPEGKLVTYRLAIDEQDGVPVVVDETLRWSTAPGSGRSRDILGFGHGQGFVYDEPTGEYSEEELDSPDLLAVSTLGQLSRHPRVAALRRFISGWYLSYVSADNARSVPESGPQERLSQSGDNLPNVVQYLPFFADALKPKELWVLYREHDRFTRTLRAADEPRLVAMTENGGQLGDLWMEGYFGVGDPLVRSGRPA